MPVSEAVTILGGGPAGSCAALAALRQGAAVTVVEKSRFPRHKVCGEFLSPEIESVFEQLGAGQRFRDAHPPRIRSMSLHFRDKTKQANLPEPAFGLSRYAMDALLLDQACEAGASVVCEAPCDATPLILAHGRKASAPKGRRLFGFKAHYAGPAHDAVELFFFQGCYVGINSVEGGLTNVCGLGPEQVLSRCNFEIDELLQGVPALRERLAPLTRQWKWLTVGPLVFENQLHSRPTRGLYPAGDALSFVDPFTGSGLLAAATTGRLAGVAAAQGTTPEEYLAQCRGALQRPYLVSSLFRSVLQRGWAEWLAPYVPGSWLFRLTRPSVALH